MTDLDALSALLAAATPGPWKADYFPPKSFDHWIVWAGPDEVLIPESSGVQGDAWMGGKDAALIVAAVNALPSLIEAARRASEGENTDWHYCDCDSPHHAYHEAARREAGLREALTRIWVMAGGGADEPRIGALQDRLLQIEDAAHNALLHDNAGTAER